MLFFYCFKKYFCDIMILLARVMKLVDVLDSKSSGAKTPCRFDSDHEHHFDYYYLICRKTH